MINERNTLRVAVVGSGISGITSALRLHEAGFDVEVLESEERIGGRFGIDVLGERPVMTGGKNIGHKYSEFRSVVGALGGKSWEPFGINSSRVIDGEIRTLDTSHLFRSLRHTFEVGSPADLARLAVHAVRIRANRSNAFLDSPYFTGLGRSGDRLPLSAHFGPRIVQNILRPMTIRMNGAEPDEVYLGTFGTNLSLMLDTYEQLTEGIQPVLDEFRRRLPVTTGATVRRLISEDGRISGLCVDLDGTVSERYYDGIVLAVPAHAAAAIVTATHPELGETLRRVRYFPSTVALVEYDRPFFEPGVRALAMDGGPCSNAGAYGIEDRHIVRYTFSGRDARNEPSPDTLGRWLDDAERKVSGLLGITPGTRLTTLTHHWPAAYCAYGPFYGELLADLHGQLASIDGLELSGDYLLGVNLEACSQSGAAAAAQLTARLDANAAAALA
ncbi:FAD-dependent oxidoreductase [Nocardia yamanashiensis]|uniref:FAD-dependent oxidoreductase n=1 Tax=Nocardia yamanashiensis TaxID=209247 RepID=UPI0022B83514|nr:FAD-dependent oxidoreductase [Nocardia yamanashiensis]